MSLRWAAVPYCGKEVLVIRDGRVIGKGRAVTRVGDEVTSIQFTEGEIIELVQDLELVRLLGLRYSYFKYGPNYGVYLGDDTQTGVGGDEILADTLVVDAVNFRYGMAPTQFARVPGFRAALDAIGKG